MVVPDYEIIIAMRSFALLLRVTSSEKSVPLASCSFVLLVVSVVRQVVNVEVASIIE